jgi:hypothetical protein
VSNEAISVWRHLVHQVGREVSLLVRSSKASDLQRGKIVRATNSHETVLLLNEVERKILPLSTCALNVSIGPKKKVLRQLRSLVVFRNGSIFRIDGIDFNGFFGSTIGRRLFSAVNGGVREISVHLSPASDVSLQDILRIAIEHLEANPEVIEDYFSENAATSLTLEKGNSIRTVSELFDSLQVPAPEDVIDFLS